MGDIIDIKPLLKQRELARAKKWLMELDLKTFKPTEEQKVRAKLLEKEFMKEIYNTKNDYYED